MQHADAQERLSELALEPVRLARLEEDRSFAAVELRAHMTACERCAADLVAWRRTWSETAAAMASADDPSGAVRQPGGVRERLIATATAEPLPADGRTASGRARSGLAGRLPWLAAAAALIVAVGAGTLSVTQSTRLEELLTQMQELRAQNQELTDVASALDRILADPDHRTVALRTADGTTGGTLAWTVEHLTIVTTGLPAPGPGQRYRCWAERDGTRTPLGWMSFSGSTGYWAGSISSYGSGLPPGGRFGVSLVPDDLEGTPVLIADL